MLSMKNQIIDEIKSQNIVSEVRDFYSQADPIFPMITVQEFPTSTGLMTNGQPNIVTNYYQFEIYCKNTILNKVITSANDKLFEFGVALDNYVNTKYLMNQVGEPIILPYPSDQTVMRWVVRYSLILGENNDGTISTYRRY